MKFDLNMFLLKWIISSYFPRLHLDYTIKTDFFKSLESYM